MHVFRSVYRVYTNQQVISDFLDFSVDLNSSELTKSAYIHSYIVGSMPKVAFTAGRVRALSCPADKKQAFLWDTGAPGLGLRVTPNGEPSFIFQSRCNGSTMRITIGSPDVWTIPLAQAKAREYQRLIDEGLDPRVTRVEQERLTASKTVTVGEAWRDYVKERTPHWSERTRYDHDRIADPGGRIQARGTKSGKTMAGPLYSLFKYRFGELTPQVVEAWAIAHGKERPTYGRLCWRYFKVFLGWCSREPSYQDVVDAKIAASRKVRDAFGKPNAKSDHLEREQLKRWFEEVRAIQNPVTSAAIQVMLLTGARVNEVLGLKWSDVDVRWKKIAIQDKVEESRTIPLTPFVEQLIMNLPRRNEQVFSSHDSKTGSIWSPRYEFVAACERAGIQDLTLHGLRRSFASLSEWLDIPSGVIAQIMGHKPSATAEKHYKRRPIDMRRIHHERFEAWILEQAGLHKGE